MSSEFGKLSQSKQTAAKLIFETFKILKEAGGELPGRDVISKIREQLELTDWEKERYEKTGYIRWEAILHLFSIDCIKAGYLWKRNGIWYLTEEGENAIAFGPVKLLQSATEKYKKWAKENKTAAAQSVEDDISIEESTEQTQKANLELVEEKAVAEIKDFIRKKNPYEFQDLVAALLRAMEYHTPFISPKGRDGGIDIIAYQDPLGAQIPRIKVQVKHRPDASIAVDEIRSLIGLLNKDGDIGLFVTSGRFTSEAEKFSRDSHIHIKLIDIDSLIAMWRDFYIKLNDEEKNMMPLYPIYFLGTNE